MWELVPADATSTRTDEEDVSEMVRMEANSMSFVVVEGFVVAVVVVLPCSEKGKAPWLPVSKRS